MSINLLAPLIQAAPQPVTVDWQPLVTALVLIVPTLGAILAVFLGWLRSLVLQQKETFTSTIVHNKELELSLTAATLEITRLGVIAQSVDGLKGEVARLQTDYASLRKASDAERTTSTTQIAAYQKELAGRDETIRALKESTDATIKALQDRITDLEATVKSLIGERDKLQKDADAPKVEAA